MNREEIIRKLREGSLSAYKVPGEFWSDREVVLAAVRESPASIKNAFKELRSDRIITIEAVKGNGALLKDVAPVLKDDKETVMAAVQGYSGPDGDALMYASDRLRDDAEIATAAINSCPGSFQYISENLKKDKDIIQLALMKGASLLLVDKSFHSRTNILTAFENTRAVFLRNMFDLIPKPLLEDKEFCVELVSKNIEALSFDEVAQYFPFNNHSNISLDIDLILSTRKLFPSEYEDWESYEYKPGKLRLNMTVVNKVFGVEAYAALWIAPTDRDMSDAWEASREKGQEDWWSFLYFTCFPTGQAYSNAQIGIYFAPENFFDRNLESILVISPPDESNDDFENLSDDYQSDSFLKDKANFYRKYKSFLRILGTELDVDLLIDT